MEITIFIVVFLVVVKFFVFVSEVVSRFSKILTWILGGAKGYLCPTNSIIGGRSPRLPPKSTPMHLSVVWGFTYSEVHLSGVHLSRVHLSVVLGFTYWEVNLSGVHFSVLLVYC